MYRYDVPQEKNELLLLRNENDSYLEPICHREIFNKQVASLIIGCTGGIVKFIVVYFSVFSRGP